MDIKLAVIGFAIHLVFFASIFDIYFTSPLVHGMTPQVTTLDPPAKRLVLFIADGLRADKFLELNETGQSNAPYLRNLMKTSASWGISHTRVPTESRPGHVALIAGFYEDVSAVTKGWKENPVDFDSVFNESRYTWSWGEEDILVMFAKGAAGNHVSTHFREETQNFAEADASIVDTWVFDRVTEFFNASTKDRSLSMKLHQNKIVFFLHLLGIDSNGHAHKPYSKQYLENIQLVDAGVQKMVQLFDDYYQHDERTSYILTSDHGMTDWGSHGASHPDETVTPIVAWGAGIKTTTPSGKEYYQDEFSKDLGLARLRRNDINQADIAPLMASMIGVPFPMNSVGLLPIGYLDNSESFKAKSMLTNVRQILAQYEIKETYMHETTLAIFFRPFQPLWGAKKLEVIQNIETLIQDGSFEGAINMSQDAIAISLKGLHYYQTYNRLFLETSVTLSYLGWMGFLFYQLLEHHTNLISSEGNKKQKKQFYLINYTFFAIGVLVTMLLYLQSSPVVYYVYCLLPVLLWHSVFRRYEDFLFVFKITSRKYGLTSILTISCVSLMGVEILVLSLFYREVVSIGLLAISIWPLARKSYKLLSLGWFLSCLVLSLFPLMPVIGHETNILLVVLAGVCLCLTGIVCYNQLQPSSKSKVYAIQICTVVMATYLVQSTWSSINRGTGLPLTNQVLSWCILIASFIVPLLVSTAMFPRLLSLGLAFTSVYILLSKSHEALFCLALCLVMTFWLLCEYTNSSEMADTQLRDVSFGESSNLDKEPPRKLELTDLRCAFFFVFFILTAFFGTGNIASLNSFDPSTVYCFITMFSPFVIGALLLWKIAILFMIVTCTFHAIHVVLRVPTAGLFLIVLLMSDLMALHFFFLVRDSGSWLEIGTSISHYVIIMCMILFLNLLLVLAKFFTTFTLSLPRRKTHSL